MENHGFESCSVARPSDTTSSFLIRSVTREKKKKLDLATTSINVDASSYIRRDVTYNQSTGTENYKPTKPIVVLYNKIPFNTL
jgi:hypothetical protein